MTSTIKHPTSTRVALVAGATGLVGRAILALLLADQRYSTVHVVGRRAPSVQHPKLAAHISASLTNWTCPAVDDVFIALGTTIKVAGSKAAFKAIDGDMVWPSVALPKLLAQAAWPWSAPWEPVRSQVCFTTRSKARWKRPSANSVLKRWPLHGHHCWLATGMRSSNPSAWLKIWRFSFLNGSSR